MIVKTLANNRQIYLTDYPLCEHAPLTYSVTDAGRWDDSVTESLRVGACRDFGDGWEVL
jgi:hypothetical protein